MRALILRRVNLLERGCATDSDVDGRVAILDLACPKAQWEWLDTGNRHDWLPADWTARHGQHKLSRWNLSLRG
jgi:hypothetical protein